MLAEYFFLRILNRVKFCGKSKNIHIRIYSKTNLNKTGQNNFLLLFIKKQASETVMRRKSLKKPCHLRKKMEMLWQDRWSNDL